MYLDIQGDFFQMVLYRSGPTQQDKLAKYTGPTQETGPPQQKNDLVHWSHPTEDTQDDRAFNNWK